MAQEKILHDRCSESKRFFSEVVNKNVENKVQLLLEKIETNFWKEPPRLICPCLSFEYQYFCSLRNVLVVTTWRVCGWESCTSNLVVLKNYLNRFPVKIYLYIREPFMKINTRLIHGWTVAGLVLEGLKFPFQRSYNFWYLFDFRQVMAFVSKNAWISKIPQPSSW